MIGHDERTERYFEEHTPVYSIKKYADVLAFLRDTAGPQASLLDIGCASGGLLKLVMDNTSIQDVAGVDVSPAYLDQCVAAVPTCRTSLASILDEDLRMAVGREFSFVVVGAVLHHLVGSTRRKSLKYAREGLANAWSLVEPGGTLIIEEPTYRPRWLMGGLFYVKRLVSSLVPGRVTIFGHWNNLGEPVVSYFSHAALVQEASELPGATLVLDMRRLRRRSLAWRLIGVRERAGSLLALRKSA